MSSEVRNGKSEIWFKRKTYGWGWTPANAKGWAALLSEGGKAVLAVGR